MASGLRGTGAGSRVDTGSLWNAVSDYVVQDNCSGARERAIVTENQLSVSVHAIAVNRNCAVVDVVSSQFQCVASGDIDVSIQSRVTDRRGAGIQKELTTVARFKNSAADAGVAA